MSKILRLDYLDEFSRGELDGVIEGAGRARSLRDAVDKTILAIHGLPEVLDADLQKVEVYIGRAGATATHLRNRWFTRHEEFGHAPSTHAMVVTRTSTDRLRDQRWERAAQLVVKRLTENDALCCANALLGDSGRWPATDDCVIYLVARVRRGPAGASTAETQINSAVAALVRDVASEGFDPVVITTAADGIQHRGRAAELEVIEPAQWFVDGKGIDEGIDEEAVVNCRAPSCDVQARPGNYGFCGRHRPHVAQGQASCKSCNRAAIPGNYGFCGRHRPYVPPGLKACRTCGRPAIPGNFGFCGRHRR